ncbi:MAG TPA: hypothetical protein VNK92_01930 [Vicinamibacterales bacterium]|jgi:hypothetical protein|nr:hypothetical protein [Vicinamibacterales bacterium]
MSARRAAVLCGAGALLAAWLAAGSSAPPLPESRALVSTADPLGGLGAAVREEAARLRARLAAVAPPSRESRNPFRFADGPDSRATPSPRRPERASGTPSAAPPSDAADLPLSLDGIAEDVVDGTRRRIAILSGLGDVHLVGAGEVVAGRYEVVAVGAEAVQLRDAAAGRTFTLTLRP